ncbi:MAG: hypothetical protein ACOYNR_11820 [Blastocatellia bacterium]|jgi:ElaB/YqjD/DUF883 family membrane-anchored ribosome-binding protein
MIVEERLNQITQEVERLREKVGQVVEQQVDSAARVVRRGKYAAEELLDDTSHRIKQDPIPAVAITFGIGVGVGILVGWLLGRGQR